MSFAYIIVNYVMIIGLIYASTFLAWNGYHYAKADDDKAMVHYKKALFASFITVFMIGGTMIVGNFIIAGSGLFVDKSKNVPA
jgi:hypothetical protein